MPLDNLVNNEMLYRVGTDESVATSGGVAGTNKLWLPLWSGEVINAYDQYNMFENMITTKSLTGGFSYEFPITGTVQFEDAWEAGQELYGGSSTSKTIKVQLDNRPMAAHFETDNVDLLVTQWDYRSEMARQAGLQLANNRDRQIAMALVAACALAPVTNDPRLSSASPAGGSLTSAAFQNPYSVGTNKTAAECTETEALKVLAGIEDYLVNCQENDVTIGQVYCVVTPKVFQVIRALGIPRTMSGNNNTSTAPLFGASSDFGGVGAPLSVGMNSMMDSLDYMGVKIVKTNHLPKVDHGSASIGASKYNLNCSAINLYGIIFQSEAIAGLSLMGMKVDTVQDVRRNTQFTVASMLKGTGVIRPETCRALTGINDSDPTRAELATALGGNFTTGFAAEYKNIGD
jgi:hypothetical protein